MSEVLEVIWLPSGALNEITAVPVSSASLMKQVKVTDSLRE